MQIAVFPTFEEAQAACDAIWLEMGAIDRVAGTGIPVDPQITTAWCKPMEREETNDWVVVVNPDVTVPGQELWNIIP